MPSRPGVLLRSTALAYKLASPCTSASALSHPSANRDRSTKPRSCCRDWDYAPRHPSLARPSHRQTRSKPGILVRLSSIDLLFGCAGNKVSCWILYGPRASQPGHPVCNPAEAESLPKETDQSTSWEQTTVHEADRSHKPKRMACHVSCLVARQSILTPTNRHQTLRRSHPAAPNRFRCTANRHLAAN